RSSATSSATRAATGAITYCSSHPFGRPRCEHTRTSAAPLSSSSRSVGSDARIRVSSATLPASSGTLRSARTSTVFPATSASRTERGSLIALEELPDQVDEAARVPPLVVVPAEDLDHPPVHHRQVAVEDAGVRRVDDVRRHDRLVRVAEDPAEGAGVGLAL